jgi:hypothetical protein
MHKIRLYRPHQGPAPESYLLNRSDAQKTAQHYTRATITVLHTPFRAPLILQPEQRRFDAAGTSILQVTFLDLPERHLTVTLQDIAAFQLSAPSAAYQAHLLRAGQGELLLELDWL